MLARSLAASIEGAAVGRIQCTPDLQPTDITGLSVWDPVDRTFEFQPGPIFVNVLVVDEINRALPKAQSALLEGMAERQVTVDGVTHPLADPFLLIATREHDRAGGDVPAARGAARPVHRPHVARLPVARGRADDRRRAAPRAPRRLARPVVALDELPIVFAAHEEVYIDPLLKRWAVELVRATRSHRHRRGRRVRARAASRSSAWRARWRSSSGATTSSRRTSSASSRSSSMHRMVLATATCDGGAVGRRARRPGLAGVPRAGPATGAHLGRRGRDGRRVT